MVEGLSFEPVSVTRLEGNTEDEHRVLHANYSKAHINVLIKDVADHMDNGQNFLYKAAKPCSTDILDSVFTPLEIRATFVRQRALERCAGRGINRGGSI